MTQDACRRAARLVVSDLFDLGGGFVEDPSRHLHPDTGWLSVDVLNVLGAANYNLHVHGGRSSLDDVVYHRAPAAFLNWNGAHWTVLEYYAGEEGESDVWVHTNSVAGPHGRHGRTMYFEKAHVRGLLEEIQAAAGDVSVHVVTMSPSGPGHNYLPPAGRQQEDPIAEGTDPMPSSSPLRPTAADSTSTLTLLSMNVDGLGSYSMSPAERMEHILSAISAGETDVLLFQEVTAAMYAALRQHLPSWKFYRRRHLSEDYFNITAVSPAFATPGIDKATSFPFPTTSNGRHVVTFKSRWWTVANSHAESGSRSKQKRERAEQLHYLSDLIDAGSDGGRACVVAGDLTMRPGDEACFAARGWEDSWQACEPTALSWTWKHRRAPHEARYDRVYVRQGSSADIECLSHKVLRDVWPRFSDHAALRVVLQQTRRGVLDAPTARSPSPPSAAFPPSMPHPGTAATAPCAPARAAAPAETPCPLSGRVPVIRLAVAIAERAALLRRRAAAVALALATPSWHPGPLEPPVPADVPEWEHLPTEGGFRMARILCDGRRRASNSQDKGRQRAEYASWQRWVQDNCGIDRDRFKAHLQTAAALCQNSRGADGLPEALRETRATVRRHALLLCIYQGCLQAAADARGHESGADEPRADGSSQELQRLLRLAHAALESERRKIPAWLCSAFGLDCVAETCAPPRRLLVAASLWQWWALSNAAASMGASDIWQRVTASPMTEETLASLPISFPLDDDVCEAAHLRLQLGPPDAASGSVRRARAPLAACWLQIAWESARREVDARYGAASRTVSSGELPGASAFTFSMCQLYTALFQVRTLSLPLKDWREATWQSLRAHEIARGRAMTSSTRRMRAKQREVTPQGASFDQRTLRLFWCHAVQAWKTDWLKEDPMPRVLPEGMQPSPEKPTVVLSSVPREDIQQVGDHAYQWGGWKVTATTADEAWQKLDARWAEHQTSHHAAREKWKVRRLGELDAAKDDFRTRRGPLQELRHPRYSETFKGAFFYVDGEERFEEERTGIVVAARPTGGPSPSDLADDRCKLYLSLRAEQAKRQRKVTQAQRKAALAQQVPSRPGDMAIKGKTPLGHLVYAWHPDDKGGQLLGPQAFEVMATPRALRPPLPDGVVESAWKQRCRRETTPERALRKMCQKVKLAAARSQRGQTERIVATATAAHQSATGSPKPQSIPHSAPPPSTTAHSDQTVPAALAQLDDPDTLAHLRAAYTFLTTCQLHYCEHYDEER